MTASSAKPPMPVEYQRGFLEAIRDLDHYAQDAARDLLIEEAKARGDTRGRRVGASSHKAMTAEQEPKPELVAAFKREMKGAQDNFLRSGVVHGLDDVGFEECFGPLDEEDWATINKRRGILGGPLTQRVR